MKTWTSTMLATSHRRKDRLDDPAGLKIEFFGPKGPKNSINFIFWSNQVNYGLTSGKSTDALKSSLKCTVSR